jgi:hypothetical protein
MPCSSVIQITRMARRLLIRKPSGRSSSQGLSEETSTTLPRRERCLGKALDGLAAVRAGFARVLAAATLRLFRPSFRTRRIAHICVLDKDKRSCFAHGERIHAVITLWSAMSDRLTEDPVWRQGLCNDGACIEAAVAGEVVMMRSTVDPGSVLHMSREEWQKFLASAKSGLFDDL